MFPHELLMDGEDVLLLERLHADLECSCRS